jgi:transglutaminase-like putative cysteine protease
MRLHVLSCALFAVAALADGLDPHFERLPFGCRVTRSEAFGDEQRAAVGARLGVALKALSNTALSIHGSTLQVCILEAASEADTPRLYQAILGAHRGDKAFCLRDGSRVVEFCKVSETALAVKAAYELGYVKKPAHVRYRFAARVATVRAADYKAFNDLSQAFFAADPARPSAETAARVAELAKGFEFGDSLPLRCVPDVERGSPEYQFAPVPVGVQTQAGDRAVFSFRGQPRSLGVPYVALTGEISCAASGLTATRRLADASLLAPTAYWPSDDPAVRALAREITAGCADDASKVAALLAWLAPGANIKAEGPAGSRWGVKRVLAQRYGHCWDASDVFVTLARAAGVPTRQVGGWLYGTGGHIWAEVLVPGKSWRQVDPTGAGRLACGIYHVPLFTTEDGAMPILYVSRPCLVIEEGEGDVADGR